MPVFHPRGLELGLTHRRVRIRGGRFEARLVGIHALRTVTDSIEAADGWTAREIPLPCAGRRRPVGPSARSRVVLTGQRRWQNNWHLTYFSTAGDASASRGFAGGYLQAIVPIRAIRWSPHCRSSMDRLPRRRRNQFGLLHSRLRARRDTSRRASGAVCRPPACQPSAGSPSVRLVMHLSELLWSLIANHSSSNPPDCWGRDFRRIEINGATHVVPLTVLLLKRYLSTNYARFKKCPRRQSVAWGYPVVETHEAVESVKPA